MNDRKNILGLSSIVIILGAIVKFTIHLYYAPEYGFFGDELYAIAMSRHLAFGYVDLPPLVPALVALSRALLGDSLFAHHIFPALAGAATLVFVGLIAKEYGGKTFAVLLSVLGFIAGPLWLAVNSIFCYDCFDQLVTAAFLYVLVRFLRSGNHRLWLLLGLIAGIACLTKMTIMFLGPGFLIALLISKYRRDLPTPWPWLGAVICVVVASPYLLWQVANGWPTLEYWANYGTVRMWDKPSIPEFLVGILLIAGPLLLPLCLGGLYRIFRRLDGVDYGFLGWLFVVTAVMLFLRNTPVRLIVALYMPLLAAGAVLVEELSARVGKGAWVARVGAVGYLLLAIAYYGLTNLPILSLDRAEATADILRFMHPPHKEFGVTFRASPILPGKRGWDELVQEVAEVYDELPPEERAVAGIYADWYLAAGAIDELGPEYGLPHAVSGSLTYYLWGPGYSWDVMITVSRSGYPIETFFEECEVKKTILHPYAYVNAQGVRVCRNPKYSADEIWSSLKRYR